MNTVLAAELRKQRSTRTDLTLLLTLLGLGLFAVALHAFSLSPDQLVTVTDQMRVFGWGVLAALFAGIGGAMTIATEFRHGTIRSTFLVTPRRGQVLTAKLGASALTGATFGFAVELVAIVVGSSVLAGRGIDIALAHPDVVRLLLGGALVGALWAAFGLGLGAILRNQVTALVGLATWLLFIENLLIAYIPDVGRLAPGQAGFALMGQDPDILLPPAVGALVLAAWSALAATAGRVLTMRRDVP
ncbi:ABC transporter permease [Parafrankia sp. BMG5.11]|uniref:ABC transporter permease n=1 Tax=Parafrankia sp. BMG5.11 TaxID=222540 RepID=UPI00103CB617|nr:ABC transporter permease subunit [Parafrankia sp. BMG5.11]TCJ33530.1 ABC transporter permease [Parafrankia sp. BMG5.11]